LNLDSLTRIAIILPSFAGGGAERVMLQVATNLDRDRFLPMIIVLDGSGPLRRDLAEDIQVYDLQTPKLRRAIWALRDTISRLRPNVVFSTMGYLNMGVILANIGQLSPKPRIVIREANIPAATLNALGSPILCKLGYRFLYRLADAVLCNAELVRDELAAMGVPHELISVVPNPIDIDQLRHLARANPSTRHGGFIAAGRLVPQKGFDRMLEWFTQFPGIQSLTIFGEGPQRTELTALIKKLGLSDRVHLPGYCEQPWSAIANADAFLLPSRWEGMPNAALEALAVGTPVVACREAGGIAAIACMAAGAVQIVDGGVEFVAAMESIPPRVTMNALRPSLLPDTYALDTAVHLYEEILSGNRVKLND
jgi:glycosyltransferase involved in cell wall biosynthesis